MVATAVAAAVSKDVKSNGAHAFALGKRDDEGGVDIGGAEVVRNHC